MGNFLKMKMKNQFSEQYALIPPLKSVMKVILGNDVLKAFLYIQSINVVTLE